MKAIFLLCLLLSIANKVFSQADTTAPGTSLKNDYLQKSKNKKTVAWVLLGNGYCHDGYRKHYDSQQQRRT